MDDLKQAGLHKAEPAFEPPEPLTQDLTGSVSPRRLLTNMGNSVVSLIGAMILGFAVSWLLARSLGDTVYGEYVFMLGIAGILTAFADLGLSQVLIRQIAKDRTSAGQHVTTVIALRMLGNSLVMVAAIVIVTLDEAQRAHEGLALIVVVSMMITLLTDLIRSAFTGFERLELDLVTRISERAVTLIIVILLVLGTITLPAAILGILAGALTGLAITSVTALRTLPVRPFRFHRPELRPTLHEGLPIGISIMVVGFYSRYDVLVLGVLRSSSEVAWFSVAYSLILVLISLSFAASGTLFPVLSRLAHSENLVEHRALFQLMLRYTLVAGFACAGIVFIMAEPIIQLLYGPTYAPAATALEVLAFALIFLFPAHLAINTLFSMSQQKAVLVVHIISGVLLLFLDPLLINAAGIVGAAVSNVVIEATVLGCLLVLVTRVSGRVPVAVFLRPLAAGCLGVLVYVVWPSTPLARAVLAYSVFMLALFAVRALTVHDIQRLVAAMSGKLQGARPT